MDWDLPEWIENKLDINRNRDIQQHHVAELMVNGDRPYYNIDRLEADLDASDDTIRERLREMGNKGVVKKEDVNNGNVYWINYDESQWPIPPDTDVEGSTDEQTVTEFFGQRYVVFMAVGVLMSMIAGPIIWMGTFQAGGQLALPLQAENVLAGGLLAIFFAYAFILIGILVWVIDKGFSDGQWRELIPQDEGN